MAAEYQELSPLFCHMYVSTMIVSSGLILFKCSTSSLPPAGWQCACVRNCQRPPFQTYWHNLPHPERRGKAGKRRKWRKCAWSSFAPICGAIVSVTRSRSTVLGPKKAKEKSDAGGRKLWNWLWYMMIVRHQIKTRRRLGKGEKLHKIG